MFRVTSTIVFFLIAFLALSIVSMILVKKASGSEKVIPFLLKSADNIALCMTEPHVSFGSEWNLLSARDHLAV